MASDTLVYESTNSLICAPKSHQLREL